MEAHSPATPNDFYSEPDDLAAPSSPAFTAHRDALFTLSRTVATLTAASVLTQTTQPDPRYATHAADHLRAWFLTPATRMNPNLQYGQRTPKASPGHFNGNFKGLVETIPLAEVAQSIPFLASSSALTPDELSTLRAWFADYLKWLTEDPLATLARDQKDHHGSSWLLQSAACDLLSTRFESVWDYELQDGPGMRTAIAFHAPFIANRSSWPYPADAAHFTDLPGRRISLLLAGRAYSYPQYTEEWQSLPPIPDTAPAEIRRSDPLSQPLLWVTHPKPVPLT